MTARLRSLMALREEILRELASGEQELARLRANLERLESDVRLGDPIPLDYADLKGHALPRAERRLVDLFGDLLKVEDKIRAARGSGTG